jgi:prepilin-type N-terminal cleavage/methylation domain-containing protein
MKKAYTLIELIVAAAIIIILAIIVYPLITGDCGRNGIKTSNPIQPGPPVSQQR